MGRWYEDCLIASTCFIYPALITGSSGMALVHCADVIFKNHIVNCNLLRCICHFWNFHDILFIFVLSFVGNRRLSYRISFSITYIFVCFPVEGMINVTQCRQLYVKILFYFTSVGFALILPLENYSGIFFNAREWMKSLG